MRTPQQIIGDDLYKQLIFEGYIVSLLSRQKSDVGNDAKPDVLERLEFCVGPWRDYSLVDDIKVEIATLRERINRAGALASQKASHDLIRDALSE